MLNSIKKICYEFVNDYDTVIGMQCDWHDYLVKEVHFDMDKEKIMQALQLDTAELVVTVEQLQYEEIDVYIAIRDRCVTISTKKWLL
jgi:hypothetical protein